MGILTLILSASSKLSKLFYKGMRLESFKAEQKLKELKNNGMKFINFEFLVNPRMKTCRHP